MGYTTLWKRLTPGNLNISIQIFSLISMFFEGYDQGVMGGVNASPRYVQEVDIGRPNGVITDRVHQGGIVSVLFVGSIFALIGGALQAATQSSDFILVARVVTGLGTGALTGITPVLVSETSTASHRGSFLGYVFIANYLGISVAYWLNFGLSFIDNGYSDIRWRLLLAFQCLPALLLLAGVKMLPDSPRYLAIAGRHDEAREVLEHLRGSYDAEVEMEYVEIVVVAKKSKKSSPLQFAKILVGKGGKTGHHLGRRAWLCMLLQIMASWTGITVVTAYAPVLLSQAGYSTLMQSGLAGGVNTVGIAGTIISAQIVDRLGRRMCLMGGAAGLFAVNVIAGSLYEAVRWRPELATQLAPAAVTMLFLFNICYAATWGTVAFLVPTEIWSSDMRAQGNGFGITGWAVGVGWTVLVNPLVLAALKNRTYFLLAGLNLIWIPVIYLFYPETADRSLESIDALFSSSSPFSWKMEQAYREHGGILVETETSVSLDRIQTEAATSKAQKHGVVGSTVRE
ncbi:mfs sugar transporter [Diplodia corticola]|uniref:Mfs sugar transporter n=1 Tax=Diplodia corticola TaxID=236234 RepID=A0A1J9RH26_9PEZI|nr:mfs sugar transporter [Diplodia corticola]OJD31851.1 mfs sugar transporter [Diplodia corticola]